MDMDSARNQEQTYLYPPDSNFSLMALPKNKDLNNFYLFEKKKTTVHHRVNLFTPKKTPLNEFLQ